MQPPPQQPMGAGGYYYPSSQAQARIQPKWGFVDAENPYGTEGKEAHGAYQHPPGAQENKGRYHNYDVETGHGPKPPGGVYETATTPYDTGRLEKQIRLGFIRKVYSILSLQLLLTIAVSCAFALIPAANSFVLATPSLFYLAMVLSFVTIIACMCYRHRYPLNAYLLLLFTCVEAYTLGLVVAAYYNSGAGHLVLQAFVITAAIFVGLTLLTFVSKIDFGFLGMGLFAATMGLMVWGIILSIMGWRMSYLYSLIGAIIFSGWILVDTSNLIHRYSPDDWVIVCISLYLDIINLFLFILRLLSSGDRQ